MKFSNKNICILIIIFLFLVFSIFYFTICNDKEKTVTKVLSPISFLLDDNEEYKLSGIETFSPDYTNENAKLCKLFNMTEDEAFIFGNFGKYWAKNLLEGRKIKIKENNLIYYKFAYLTRLKKSSFAIVNGKPLNEQAFQRQLASIRRGKYVLLDIDTDIYYPISKNNRNKLKNFIVVRQNHVKNALAKKQNQIISEKNTYNSQYTKNNIKIIVSDFTTKTFPDRNCSSDICKELLSKINSANSTIDIAVYGYSSTPKIEQALKKAVNRGVKIRLVYDIDSKGNNIYPDTFEFIKIIPNNINDKNSSESRYTMHNKFYIFDNKTVITGSANLSHTDMSGYNSNSIIVIDSPDVAKFYSEEFNQMFNGKFHNDKYLIPNKTYENIQIFFSPKDNAINSGVLPLIKNTKKYIYIPAFVITENDIVFELINAKKRGVDVRIIADSLNSITKHSKSKELRNAGILVKAENYAGKMHSKTMIIDDEYLIIGSMNFSYSGEKRNDENMIIIKDKDASKFYKEFFLYQWNKIPDKWLKYTPRSEGPDSIGSCSDGIDNNYDGLTDMEDEACKKLK